MKKYTLSFFFSFFFALLIAGATVAYAQWQEPNDSPPTCTSGPGCEPPINTGATEQNRTGTLEISNGDLEISNGGLCIDSDSGCSAPGAGGMRIGSGGIHTTDTAGNILLHDDLEFNSGGRLLGGGNFTMESNSGFLDFRPSDGSHGLIIRDFDGSSTAWGGIRTQDDGSMELRADGGNYSQLVLRDGNRVGVNTSYPNRELDVNGTVRIRGGNPADGKVLTATSTAGYATWENPSGGGALETYTDSTTASVSPGATNNFTSPDCASGYSVTGGGTSASHHYFTFFKSHPAGDNWACGIYNDQGFSTNATCYVVCAK